MTQMAGGRLCLSYDTGDHEVSRPPVIVFDDDLWVIEMTVVERPFVLDFAGAYLDETSDKPHRRDTLAFFKSGNRSVLDSARRGAIPECSLRTQRD